MVIHPKNPHHTLIGIICIVFQLQISFNYMHFYRLWNRDNHPERYFFYFRKVDSASGLSLRIAPKGNMSRMKNVPDNYSATKTFAATAKTGTKIKFDD